MYRPRRAACTSRFETQFQRRRKRGESKNHVSGRVRRKKGVDRCSYAGVRVRITEEFPESSGVSEDQRTREERGWRARQERGIEPEVNRSESESSRKHRRYPVIAPWRVRGMLNGNDANTDTGVNASDFAENERRSPHTSDTETRGFSALLRGRPLILNGTLPFFLSPHPRSYVEKRRRDAMWDTTCFRRR